MQWTPAQCAVYRDQTLRRVEAALTPGEHRRYQTYTLRADRAAFEALAVRLGYVVRFSEDADMGDMDLTTFSLPHLANVSVYEEAKAAGMVRF